MSISYGREARNLTDSAMLNEADEDGEKQQQ